MIRIIELEFFLKLHTDFSSHLNTVTAYGDGYIEVNQVRFSHAVTFGPEGDVSEWPAQTAEGITASLLQQAAGLTEAKPDPLAFLDDPESGPTLVGVGPEVLLVGTGQRQYMLNQSILYPLLKAGVGVEVMDTKAAARTYNILMAEGRRVVVALLPI
jgi:uncharacterized protein